MSGLPHIINNLQFPIKSHADNFMLENSKNKLQEEIKKGELKIIKEKILSKRLLFCPDSYNDAQDRVERKANQLAERLGTDKVYYDFISAASSTPLNCHRPKSIYLFYKAKFYFCKKKNKS